MRKMMPMVALVLAILLIPAVAFAASPWTEKSTNGDKILYKLDFGIKNLLAGWTEIITVPMDYHKEGMNIFKGVGMGLFNAVVYTAGGALHTVTFFIPQIDVPLPDNGVDLS